MQLRAFSEDDPIGISALVTMKIGTRKREVFIAPAGGGLTLKSGIQVVTPSSPLGQTLVGAYAGDTLVVERGNIDEEIDVVAVS